MDVTLSFFDDGLTADEARAAGGEPTPLLITGAGGRVGVPLSRAAHEAGRYRLRLMVQSEDQADRVAGLGEVVVGDVLDPVFLASAVEGIDSVIHLAANPSTAARWDDLLGPNIEGVYRQLAAARQAGCRRLVFASSINAITGLPDAAAPAHEDLPPTPRNLYGAAKAFGETVGRVFADTGGPSVICVRLGGFMPVEDGPRRVRKHRWLLTNALAAPDACDLLLRCVDDRRVRYGVFHAASDCPDPAMSLDRARDVLGYRPTHRITEDGFVSTGIAAASPA